MDAKRESRAPIVAVGAVDPSEDDGPWDPTFCVDDGQAYQAVLGIFQGNKGVWTHVKKTPSAKSARKLICAYVHHFLGPN